MTALVTTVWVLRMVSAADSQGGGTTTESTVTEEGVWLDADVEFIGESWQCGEGEDCWAWNVTPAADCNSVDIVFGLGDSETGESQVTDTRRVHLFYAGQPTEVVLSIDPQPHEYAAIEEIWCMD